MNHNYKKQSGYVALIALLIVVTAGLTISLAVSMGGIEEIKISFGISKAAEAKNMANACLEEGLERLRNNWINYTGSLSIDDNSCIINTAINGSTATLVAKGTADIYTQKIQVQVDSNLEVSSWLEE